MRKGDPELAVKTYAKLSCTPNEDRGEMAYVVSLATKWIGDYDSFRQRARLIGIQVKLGRTVPEDIAQGRVGLWYFIDKNGKFWEKLGNEISGKNPRHSNVTAIVKHKATGKETFVEDVFLEGIELGRARIPIRPIMRAAGVKNSSHVSKGKYLLKTFASSEKGGSFSIEVGGISKSFTVKGDKVLELDLELKDDAVLQANAAIIDGNVVLCGLILEPVAD